MTYQDDLVRRLHGPQGERWVDPSVKPQVEPPAMPAAPTGPTSQPWSRQNVMQAISQYAPTREGLDQAIQANPWLGSQVGSNGGKIQNPQNGEVWDVIKNLSSGNGSWQTLTGHTSRGKSAPSGGGQTLQGGIASLLTGDPMAGIQNALSQYTGQSDYLQQLLAQLGQ